MELKPLLTPSAKHVTFAFQSKLARIELCFGAATDTDVRKVEHGGKKYYFIGAFRRQ